MKMKQPINEHDETRKMLDILRENSHNRHKMISMGLLTEQDDMPTNNDDKRKLELIGDDLIEEKQNFMNAISSRVEFEPFVIYPDDKQVQWSGEFSDTNLKWTFSLDDPEGVWISGNLIQLRDSTLKLLKKLSGYYSSWSKEWNRKLISDYGQEGEEENL